MKFRHSTILITLGVISLYTSADAADNTKQAAITAISQRTEALDNEIIALRQQIKQIQLEKRKKATLAAQQKKAKSGKAAQSKTKQGLAKAEMQPGFVLIKAGGANPVIADFPAKVRNKLTSTATPLKLLQERQKADRALKKQGITVQKQPAVEVGGSLIGAASLRRSYLNRNSSDINLAGASFSVAVEANSWVVGVMKLNYASGNRLDGTNLPYRIGNSRLFLNTAAVTIGNLERAPIYASMGQMVVPFGYYSGSLPNLTSRLGKTLERAIVIGFQQPRTTEGFNAALFGFRGDSRIYPENRINNGGMKIGYIFGSSTLKVDTGASVIANIADSAGMQNTRAPFALFDDWAEADELGDEDFEGEDVGDEPGPIPASFAGFGKMAASEILVHRVPGLDLYGKITVRDFSLIGEYTGATRSFDIDNLQFNDVGARPRAYNIEASYRFKVWNHVMAIAAGYSRSYEALPLNMPEHTLSVGLRALINKHLTAGMIYRHDKNYAIGNKGYGQGLPVLGDNALGRSSNSLTAQLGFKF